jgi:hypothetical protein
MLHTGGRMACAGVMRKNFSADLLIFLQGKASSCRIVKISAIKMDGQEEEWKNGRVEEWKNGKMEEL